MTPPTPSLIERVARIIDPEAFAALDRAEIAFGAWVEGSLIGQKFDPIIEKAEAILAALTETEAWASDVGRNRIVAVVEQLNELSPDGLEYVRLLPEAKALLAALSTPSASGEASDKAVMPCPVCEGEGEIADGLDEAACSMPCPRCDGNAWLVDLAALAFSGKEVVVNDGRGLDAKVLAYDKMHEAATMLGYRNILEALRAAPVAQPEERG